MAKEFKVITIHTKIEVSSPNNPNYQEFEGGNLKGMNKLTELSNEGWNLHSFTNMEDGHKANVLVYLFEREKK